MNTFQLVMCLIFTVIGIAYLAAFILNYVRNKKNYINEPGDFKILLPVEFAAFILVSMGISDFLMNTLISEKFHLNTDKGLPSTVVAGSVVGNCAMTVYYIRSGAGVDVATMLILFAGFIFGAFSGNLIVDKLDGKTLRKLLGILLVVTIFVLIAKMILSRGTTGTLTEFTGMRLVGMAVVCFICGAINMLGVPGKPALTAYMLIIGMSPLATVTWLLAISSVSPSYGAIRAFRLDNYNHKQVISAATAGAAGGLLGCTLAVSINQTLLNVILISVMAVAAYSILHKKKQ